MSLSLIPSCAASYIPLPSSSPLLHSDEETVTVTIHEHPSDSRPAGHLHEIRPLIKESVEQLESSSKIDPISILKNLLEFLDEYPPFPAESELLASKLSMIKAVIKTLNFKQLLHVKRWNIPDFLQETFRLAKIYCDTTSESQTILDLRLTFEEQIGEEDRSWFWEKIFDGYKKYGADWELMDLQELKEEQYLAKQGLSIEDFSTVLLTYYALDE